MHSSSGKFTMRTWRRTRTNTCLLWLLKLSLFLVLLVVLVVPVRNAVLKFLLPGLWLEHSSFFLLKVIMDFQYFPVTETPIGRSPVKITVNFNDIQEKFTSGKRTFSAYYERTSALKEMSQSDIQAQEELDILLKFQPLMTEHERAIALFTIDTFKEACKAANLMFFLISGSVLGAVRHHGMIPWDDDMDVAMNASQWKEIRNVLSGIEGFELYTPEKSQWKFYMQSLPQGNRPFKWPNIDIFFFNEDRTHIWAQTWGAKGSLCSKKSDIFPLGYQKFELWNLPVPRSFHMLAAAEFGNHSISCKTPSYVHKTNNAIPSSSLSYINCQRLHQIFPFVFHETSRSGYVLEVLKVAGKPLEKISVGH